MNFITEENVGRGRIKFLYFCLLLAFLIVSIRLIFVVASGDKVNVSKFYNSHKNQKRANIIDRNGVILATDLKAKSLYASKVLIKNPKTLAKKLSKIFPDLKYKDAFKKLSSRNRKWILIKRAVTPKEQKAVRSLKVAGLIFEPDLARVYPQKSILSHIVGYVDLDRNGLSGVENFYDESLKKGKDLQLAMDVRLQDVLSDEISKAVKKYKAVAASGIIMDVTNGEVLAISSYPDFDPNHQARAKSNKKFNRATYGVYELGSIFKIFTNAIAFEDGLVKMTDKFDVSEPVKYGKFTIKDDHPIKEGIADVRTIFSKSSNIGTIKIAQKIGTERQKEMMEKFGLLDRLTSDFPSLSRPIYPKSWREIHLYTIAYGHGIAVTPLHIAASTSAMVNGGIFYQPSFAKLNHNKGRRVIKESTSKIIRKMLRDVVKNGTGKNAAVKGYEVGGKTGTAERAEFGSYSEKKTIASFLAVFPTSKPKYLVFVALDRADSKFNTGGMIAAPVARNIIEGIAPILALVPKNAKK
ncbi:MAG: cell division protein FtsI (penicillin-binding protein 3) [Lentimonas sp.]|jgi:cell division protein FtsI (penicillin-binding protein 3)